MIDVHITRRQNKALTAACDIPALRAIEWGKIGPETQVRCIRVVERIFCTQRDVDHSTTLIKRGQERYRVRCPFRPRASEKGTSSLHIQERSAAERCAVFDSYP